MNNQLLTIVAVAASAFIVSACTGERNAASLPPGKYEKTTKSVNADGTNVTNKSTTNVTVDEYGNKKAVVEQKTTTDPKGLLNKRTTTSKQVVKQPY